MVVSKPNPISLPRPATPFIGRAHEIADICQLLEDPACQLLTLVGPGGSGKTRLSIQVAMQTQNHFPNGVYFIPLTPISSPDNIVPAITNTIGVPPTGAESPV